MNIMGFALFCTKWQKYDLRFLAKVAKSMNHGICAFCAKRQKWKKYKSWDLLFLRQAAKVAKVCIMGFSLFAPSGKSGKKV